MNEMIKKLYDEMMEDMNQFAEMGQPPMNRLGGALHTIRDIMLKLRAHILLNGFADDASEIEF